MFVNMNKFDAGNKSRHEEDKFDNNNLLPIPLYNESSVNNEQLKRRKLSIVSIMQCGLTKLRAQLFYIVNLETHLSFGGKIKTQDLNSLSSRLVYMPVVHVFVF